MNFAPLNVLFWLEANVTEIFLRFSQTVLTGHREVYFSNLDNTHEKDLKNNWLISS